MRTPVQGQFGSSLHPDPAELATLLTLPPLAVERARRRRNLKVAFRARHPASAFVTGHFKGIPRPFAIRAIGPGAGQMAVLMTVLGADLHHSSCYRTEARTRRRTFIARRRITMMATLQAAAMIRRQNPDRDVAPEPGVARQVNLSRVVANGIMRE